MRTKKAVAVFVVGLALVLTGTQRFPAARAADIAFFVANEALSTGDQALSDILFDWGHEVIPLDDDLGAGLQLAEANAAGTYLQGPYAALAEGGERDDQQTSIGYDPSTGEVFVDAPAGKDLTSINVDSAAGIFTGDAAQNLRRQHW